MDPPRARGGTEPELGKYALWGALFISLAMRSLYTDYIFIWGRWVERSFEQWWPLGRAVAW